MAPHSSQSSATSPSLKRKQATISSFFTQKPSSSPAADNVEAVQDRRPQKRAASPAEPRHDSKLPAPAIEEEEEDDIVVPPPKRARINGSMQDEKKPSAEDHVPPLSQPSSQRTDIFKFQSSPAGTAPTDENDPEESQRKKEKEKLHQKFVRKLGGPDCLIGIGRTVSDNVAGAVEAEEAEEGDEPAPPPPTKGKGAKKGGSKLTPMEKQVIEIKRKHMDTLLVIEVGYKFRFFGEDARIAAKELGIVCIPGKFRFDERKLPPYLKCLADMMLSLLQISPKLISTASLPLVSPCIGCMCTSNVSSRLATKLASCVRLRQQR